MTATCFFNANEKHSTNILADPKLKRQKMGDIHNLQVLISQSPILKKYNQAQQNAPANGLQILGVAEQEKVKKKMSTVSELEETEKTEREEARKRRLKNGAEPHLVDRYG